MQMCLYNYVSSYYSGISLIPLLYNPEFSLYTLSVQSNKLLIQQFFLSNNFSYPNECQIRQVCGCLFVCVFVCPDCIKAMEIETTLSNSKHVC